MVKKLALVVAVPMLAYVGMKLYLHHKVSTAVDTMLEQARAVSDVTYDSVTSSLGGMIGIEGLTVRPHGVSDEMTVAEIAVQFPSIFYVWDLEKHMSNRELPESMAAWVRDVSFETTGAFVQGLESRSLAAGTIDADLASSDCVNEVTTLPTRQAALGYERLTMSL